MKHGLLIVAVMTAALLLVAPFPGRAQQSNDGTTPVNGLPPSFWPMGGWDGATNRIAKSDPNGILRITEEYPITTQIETPTVGTVVAITTGLKAIGNGYGIWPFGRRTFHIERAATGGAAVNPCYIYFFGSNDNVTFVPFMLPIGTAATPLPFEALAAWQDTAKTDTVMIMLPSSPATLVRDYAFPTGIDLPPYIQPWSRRDSTASTVMTLTTRWYLREQ